MKLLIVLLTSFLSLGLSGQSTIDSLVQVAELQQGEEQFRSFIQLAKFLAQREPEASSAYALRAAGLADRMKNSDLKLEALNGLGIIYAMHNKTGLAYKMLQSASQLCDSLDQPERKMSALMNLGNLYPKMMQYDSALSCYIQSLHIAEMIGDSFSQAKNLLNIGVMYSRKMDYPKSQEFLDQARLLYDQLKAGKNERLNLWNTYGMNYLETGDYEKANLYFYKALEVNQEQNNLYGLMSVNNNLGLLFDKLGVFDSSMMFYRRSNGYAEQIHHLWSIANVYDNMAILFLKHGDTDSALLYLNKAEIISKTNLFPDLLISVYERLASVYERKGDLNRSLSFYKKFHALKDSVFNIEKETALLNLESMYKADEQIQEINLLTKDVQLIRSHRMLLLSGLTGIILIGVVLLLLNWQRQKNLRQKKAFAEKETALLKEALDQKNNELATKSLLSANAGELKTRLRDTFGELENHLDEDGRRIIGTVTSELNVNVEDDSWKDFVRTFEQTHADFYRKLEERFPDLTQNEKMQCAMVKLDMTVKEISLLTFRSPRTIESARYRLKKSLQLGPDESLPDFLKDI